VNDQETEKSTLCSKKWEQALKCGGKRKKTNELYYNMTFKSVRFIVEEHIINYHFKMIITDCLRSKSPLSDYSFGHIKLCKVILFKYFCASIDKQKQKPSMFVKREARTWLLLGSHEKLFSTSRQAIVLCNSCSPFLCVEAADKPLAVTSDRKRS
jgi:hypothetical protein